MTINLLLDTNIYWRLNSGLCDDRNLPIIKQWLSQKRLNLYVPDVLKKEWEKHKPDFIEANEKKLRNHLKDIRRSNLFGIIGNVISANEEIAQEKFNEQIKLIEEIILQGIAIESNLITEFVNKIKEKGKAPFHKSKSSKHDIDACLLYSTILYLKNTNANKLYFVSDNHSQFAAPGNKTIIHPDFLEPGIEIIYFTNLNDAVENLKGEGLRVEEKIPPKAKYKIRNDVSINSASHLIDQIHDLLKEKFNEFNYLPRHFFCEQYPFITNERTTADFPFSINTDNEPLYDLLTKVQFENNVLTGLDQKDIEGCTDYEQKLRFIFQTLYHNLAQQVYFKNDKQKQLYTYPKPVDDLLITKLQYLRIDEFFSGIEITDQLSLVQLMEIGYACYKIKAFVRSVKAFKLALEKARNNNSHSLIYLISFNLSILADFIPFYYFPGDSEHETANELAKINLDEIYKENVRTINKTVIDWLHKDELLSDSILKITEIVAKINEDFYEKNRGWNTYTLQLLNQFFDVEYFLAYNNIVYDEYGDYKRLVSAFTEGLFASHACAEGLRGKLTNFPIWLLDTLLWQGDAPTIRKLFSKYGLNKLACESIVAEEFANRVIKLLTEYPKINSLQKKAITGNNKRAEGLLGKPISNGLSLLAVLEISDEKIQELGRSINKYLSGDVFDKDYNILLTFRFFYAKRRKIISSGDIVELFRLLLNSEFDKSHRLISTIGEIIVLNKIEIQFSAGDFENFQKKFFEAQIGEPQNEWKLTAICDVYASLRNNAQKKTIRQKMKRLLKDNFNPYLYYYAQVQNIVSYKKKDFLKYSKYIKDITDKGPSPHPFGDEDFYTDARIDYFLNFCLKNKISIKRELKQSISKLGEYYNWFLNLDEFDYSKFSPTWLEHHYTIHFKKYFRKSRILKKHLISITRSVKDSGLLTIMIDIIY